MDPKRAFIIVAGVLAFAAVRSSSIRVGDVRPSGTTGKADERFLDEYKWTPNGFTSKSFSRPFDVYLDDESPHAFEESFGHLENPLHLQYQTAMKTRPRYKATNQGYKKPGYQEEYNRPEYPQEYKKNEYQQEYKRPEYPKEYKRPEYQQEYKKPEYSQEYKKPEYSQNYQKPEYSEEYKKPECSHDYKKPEYTKVYSADHKGQGCPKGYKLEDHAQYQAPEYFVKPITYDPYPVTSVSYCPTIKGLESQCRIVKDCSVWYEEAMSTSGTSCLLHTIYGACCPGLPYNGRGNAILLPKKRVNIYQHIDLYKLNLAVENARLIVRQTEEMETRMHAFNMTVQRDSASYGHLLFFPTEQSIMTLGRNAFISVLATQEIAKRFSLNSEEAGFGLSQFSLRDTILGDTCPVEPDCSGNRDVFRSINGACNNLLRSSWGQATAQFQRVLHPNYADGVFAPRVAEDGSQLPSARLVSISVIVDIDNPHNIDTLWVMQFGQFINHDMQQTAQFRTANGTGIQCCPNEGRVLPNKRFQHPQCVPIEIPEDDPFYAQFQQRCMNFVRSMPAPRMDCNFGHAEQMDQVTHFLDNSNVYGSSDEEALALRSFQGGELRVTPRGGRRNTDLLPPDATPELDCRLDNFTTGVNASADVRCFDAGDQRVNQHPHLAATHTIFMREHNRLARELSLLNRHWGDERIYQEARRILIAQTQHITYHEWLPLIIGRSTMAHMGLLPLEKGFSSDYDENLNPSIVNEFATAAFRFGHSNIEGRIALINRRRQVENVFLLRELFNRPAPLYVPGNLDKFLIGLATQPMQNTETYYTEEVTNHLFEVPGTGFGLDLVSLNIQRGRVHGIPGYNNYRALCGLPRAQDFDDLLDVIPRAIVDRFRLLYGSVNDIDLFIAGIAERPVSDGVVGPTFRCLIADQFVRTKRGDRFFYDLGGQPHSFTEDQLDEIRRTSFTRLICDNSDVVSHQPLAFRRPSQINAIVECDSPIISRINLLPWQEAFRNINAKNLLSRHRNT